MTGPFNPDDYYQVLPSEQYTDLPKPTRKFLDELRNEEVDAIRQIARMSPEELAVMRQIAKLGPDGSKQLVQAIRLSQSVMTVGKFARWAIITLIGIFVGAMLLAEKIMQFLSWFGNNGSPPR